MARSTRSHRALFQRAPFQRALFQRAVFPLATLFAAQAASAVQINEQLQLGGALRGRLDHDARRDIDEAGVDTLMLSGAYDDGRWSAAARYRFYGEAFPYHYVHFGRLRFAEYAWIGWRPSETRQWQFGLHRVPFGLQPLYSSSFLGTLGNIIGLEDLSMLGVSYTRQFDAWNLQAGYYARPAWRGHGNSHGTTYSVVVTPADPSVEGGHRNEERHTTVVRIARRFAAQDWEGEAGLSLYRGQLRNADTGLTGPRHAYGVHAEARRGRWAVKAQFARQQMKPRNPDGSDTVTVGAFDGTFNLAARGNLSSIDVSYELPDSITGTLIDALKPFVSYSRFDKSSPTFKPSQRLLAGMSANIGPVYVALEWQLGRNDPYLGGSSYAQSLARGGSDRWSRQFYVNVGYYF